VHSSEKLSVNEEEGIDLVAVWRALRSHRYFILLICGICGLAAASYALLATPIYRAEVVVTEVRDGNMSGAASLVSQLGGLGGLASLAGVNLAPSGGPAQEAKAVLQSRRLVEEFIKSQAILPELTSRAKRPLSLWLAVKRFREDILEIREDKRTGLTTVAVNWTDAVTAANWANGLVALANELLRRRALDDSSRNIAYLNKQIAHTNVVEVQRVMYNLIESETKTLMLANARVEYAFTVVDPAVPPEIRFSPRRTILVIGGILVGLIISLVAVYLRSAFGESHKRSAAVA
jgi:uncharacterized protein involved in exopolysaccharide biosynthesis